MMNSRTISVQIRCSASAVYQFASSPENLPRWAGAFCLSVHRAGDDWLMQTPTGSVGIRFVPENEFGVLDHVVTLPDGRSLLNPMRVITNGAGCEVMFTLLQLEGMSDEQFAQDAGMVEADLKMLKSVMEAGAS